MVEKEIKKDISLVITDKKYPEFPYDTKSSLFKSLLDLLEGLGLERNNPFATYIKPGQTALIKPNWARDKNPLGFNTESLITHSSMIKYVIDLLSIAMEGKGRIIIADAPLQNCNFHNLKKQTGIEEIINNARKKKPFLEIILEDWRITTLESSDLNRRNIQEYKLTENEAINNGYRLINLRKESFLEDISKNADRFRVTKYKPSLMKQHHAMGKHEYLIAGRVFEADFLINLPKIKTHIKSGLTCALKNMIGINGHKEFLPHHTKGSSREGGDNYAEPNWIRSKYEDLYDYVWENANNFSVLKRKILMKVLRFLWFTSTFFGAKNISAGSWIGNDTLWRTTLDLNHIAYFNSEKPLKILNIADGIIAGEGQGPLEPTPKPLGVLLAGENSGFVDAVVAKMMSYSISKVPTVYNAIYNNKSKFSGFIVENQVINFNNQGVKKELHFNEIPEFGFKKPLFWEEA
jgi:uncharacterized protein (DUF362 family)